MFLDRVIHFGETLGDQVNARSLKKLESLIEVPNVVHVKVHALSFSMILITSPQRVPTPSYPFRKGLGDKVKRSFSEKAKNLNRGFLSMSSKSTCF